MGNCCSPDTVQEDVNTSMAPMPKEAENKNQIQTHEEYFKTHEANIKKKVKEAKAPNKNDGKNDKIYKAVTGSALATHKGLGNYSVALDGTKGLKNKASKGKGFKYQGQHMKKEKHGYGIRVTDDGAIYEGIWSHDQPKGKGRRVNADGSFFEGIFNSFDDFKIGTLVVKNQMIYEGEFKGKLAEGSGKQSNSQGDVYVGTFKAGKREGDFAVQFKNGDLLIATFKADQIDGKAMLYYSGGDYYEGLFKQGIPGGAGVLCRENIIFTGEFKGHGLNGEYSVFDDGKTTKETWKNDKKAEAGKETKDGASK